MSSRNPASLRALVQRSDALRGYLLLTPMLVFMFVLVIVPATALVVLSFWTQRGFEFDMGLTLANYARIFALSGRGIGAAYSDPFGLFANPIYLNILFRSVLMALTVTVIVILLAYPMAYFLALRLRRGKLIWLILITVPFWTSYLLRVFAWKVILGFNGVINSGLMSLGLIDKPLEFLLYNPVAVVITLTHAWVAFAVLPIYVSLEKIDRSLIDAAADLGDGPFMRFLRVTLPLSLPGTIAAALLVFIPTVGDYVAPTLVGGTSGAMIGNLIQSLFGKTNNAPLGAAVSIVTMLTVTLLVCLFLVGVGRLRKRGI